MEKLTIWQQLSQVLNPSLDLKGKVIDAEINNIQHDKSIIDNSNSNLSQQELELKYLTQKQSQLIANQHIKATSSILNNPYYQNTTSNRINAYADYDGMCFYPIIGAAIDLISEECVTVGNNGKILTVFSNKHRIKNELEHLFYNVLDINSNIFYWTRTTVKYGDCFLYLITMETEGIKGVIQLPMSEMERIEKVENKKISTEFKRLNINETYSSLQIAHFRLLSDDKYLPYGTSIIDKARRTVKQLVMVEDAMLMYRIERAPERRVFKIDVGNIAQTDVGPYMQKISNVFKKQTQVSKAGQISHRYDAPHSTEDYFIPVRNGQNTTVIDTLPGAANLDQIDDLKYLRANLVTSLGIPGTFLGFEEATGDGKNLAMADVRFAKKVNRIQQAMIQELNKIALIHLYLKGYRGDDLEGYTLALTNPSIQGEILKIETMKAKMDLYIQATAIEDNKIAPMSHTRGKKDIFGWTDNEIVKDAQEQAFERLIGLEITSMPTLIKNSGIFNDLIKRYKPLQFEKDLLPKEPVDGESSELSTDIGGSTTTSSTSDFDGGADDMSNASDTGEEDINSSVTDEFPIATDASDTVEPISTEPEKPLTENSLLVENKKLNNRIFKNIKTLDEKINE